MQAAVRPRYAAGVALVGASLVATATIAPMPDIHLPAVHLPAIHMADVDLAAVVNPLEVYSQVFQTALTNASTLFNNGNVGQVLQQIIANQASSVGTLANGLQATGGGIANALAQLPPLVQTAVSQLAAGQVSDAVNTLLVGPVSLVVPAQALLPALETVLTKPLQNLINVIHSFNADPLATQLLLSSFIAPLISTPAAAGAAIQNVINAVGTGDPLGALNAIVAAPATIADGFLNGGYGPDLGPIVGLQGVIVKAGGLLSSTTFSIGPNGEILTKTGGPIAAMEQLINQIVTAIRPPKVVPPATAEVASLPKAAATTVNLTTGSTAASVPATAAPATDTAAGTDAAKPSTQTPGATDGTVADTPKDATDATTDSSDATTGKSESDSTTKDSTKPESTDASDGADTKSGTDTKSGADTKAGTDTKSGNKSEPQNSAGSASSTGKPGGSTGSTAGHESSSEQAGASKPANSGPSGAGAEKGENHASKASGSASKGK